MGVQLIEYKVSEDAIPLDPSSSSAGYGQLTYTRLGYDDGEDSIDLEKPYTLTDLKRASRAAATSCFSVRSRTGR